MKKCERDGKVRNFSLQKRFIFLFVLAGLFAAIGLHPSVNTRIVEAQTDSTTTVLHFQGNTEDAPQGSGTMNCVGDGAADIINCGGPFLSENSVLSTGASARWGPVSPAVNGTSARNIYDPNWIWYVSAPKRIGGAATLEWWASCGGCAAGVTNANWTIKFYDSAATGAAPVFTTIVTTTPSAPNVVEKLSAELFLPEINITGVMVLTIDPVFIDAQQNTNILYDSQLPCTGAVGGVCDSTLTLQVFAAGEPIPTPTPNPPAPASACALPSFDNYQPPDGYPKRDKSGEPSIGINWNTNNVMTMSRLQPNRTTFTDSTSPADPITGVTWFPFPIPTTATGLDPIGFTDPVTGRSFYGELNGNFTNGIISDDDLATNLPMPTIGFSPTTAVDHQTIGGGPPNPNIVGRQPTTSYPNLVYYAAQDVAEASVATSLNGGLTFEPAIPAYTLAQCGGLHGHIKVAPDGTVYLPNKNCGGKAGFAISENNGLTWSVRTVPFSTNGKTDPSIGIGAGGRLFYSYTASNNHPHVVISDDKGLSWRNDFDLALSITPGNLTAAVFMEAVAGDNNRAAVFFLATDSTMPGNPVGDDTGGTVFKGTWFPYIATTCDGGASWSVVRADNNPLFDGVPNPVQQGVICTTGTTCPAGTRNLLDFNEIAVDSRGRITAVYADGCNFDHPCINTTDNTADKSQNQGIARMTIIRQRGGPRLFSLFDSGGPAPPPLAPPVFIEEDKRGYSLKWATPDDGGSPLTGYRIYRGQVGRGEKLISEVKPGVHTFRDNPIRNAVLTSRFGNYYYHVTAINKFGESPRANKVFASKDNSRGQ